VPGELGRLPVPEVRLQADQVAKQADQINLHGRTIPMQIPWNVSPVSRLSWPAVNEKRSPSVRGYSRAGPGPWYRRAAMESRRHPRIRRGRAVAVQAAECYALSVASQRWLRGWLALARVYAVDHFLEHDVCGNGAPVEPFLTKGTRHRIADLISDGDDLLGAFELLPVTVAHHDPQWGKLWVAAPDESPARTGAIDWGFFGIAPLARAWVCTSGRTS
jgi:hypothetical protein